MTMNGVNMDDCPHHCKCKHTDLKCYKHIPSFIPQKASHISVYEIPAADRLNFRNPGWINVTHLSLNMETEITKTKMYFRRTLHAREFTGLINLEYLQIRCSGKCELRTVNNSFYGLENVKVLDLSNNIIYNMYRLTYGFYGQNTLPHLSKLYLSNLKSYTGNPIDLELSHLHKTMINKPLKVLD